MKFNTKQVNLIHVAETCEEMDNDGWTFVSMFFIPVITQVLILFSKDEPNPNAFKEIMDVAKKEPSFAIERKL